MPRSRAPQVTAMPRRLALALVALAVSSLAACPNVIDAGPGTAAGTACALDADCALAGGGVCVDGACVPPLPVAEGEGEAGGEGEPGEGEGEGEGGPGGEGEGEGAGEGEGEGAGEGEGEGEPLAQTLTVTAGPELVDALPGCFCAAPAPAANVDLEYRSAAGTCRKPANGACALEGANCPCDLGAGNGTSAWGGARVESPRQGDTWIIDEMVVHEGAADGSFVAKVGMANDCLLAPASLDASANHGCCMLDCDAAFGGERACFDYPSSGLNCSTVCQSLVTIAMNGDCMAQGPAPVRVRVEVQGAAGFVREWCTIMATGEAFDAVEIQRENGRFGVVAFDPALTEIAPGQPCP